MVIPKHMVAAFPGNLLVATREELITLWKSGYYALRSDLANIEPSPK